MKTPIFLTEDFGRLFFEEFKARADKEFNNNSYLDVLTFYPSQIPKKKKKKYLPTRETNLVENSNPYSTVLANQILNQENCKIPSPAEMNNIRKNNLLGLKGHYIDLALILRDQNQPNEYLAKDLINQLKNNFNNVKLPLIIPLNTLELRNDRKSPSGLAFNITDSTELMNLNIFNSDTSNFSWGDINEKTGVPTRLVEKNSAKESPTFFTRSSGLASFCLTVNLNLDSYYSNLGNSFSIGRIIAMSRT